MPDTTLSQALPDTNVNVYDGDPYVSPGNNSSFYGDTRGPSGSRGATYLTMEQSNADQMVRGFTGGARGCRIAGL